MAGRHDTGVGRPGRGRRTGTRPGCVSVTTTSAGGGSRRVGTEGCPTSNGTSIVLASVVTIGTTLPRTPVETIEGVLDL